MNKFLTNFVLLHAIANHTVEKCLNSLSHSYLHSNFVVMINADFILDLPLIRLGSCTFPTWHAPPKIEAYIINTKTDNYTVLIDCLKTTRSFNPRAKFIIVWYLPMLDTELLHLLGREYITTVLILMVVNLSWVKYRPGSNVHSPGSEIEAVGTCLEELPRGLDTNPALSWGSSTLRVQYKKAAPYTIAPNAALKGIEIDIINVLGELLGFKIHYMLSNATFYNTKQPSTFYDVYGDLIARNADVFFGGVVMKGKELEELDVSFPYLKDSTVWIAPRAVQLEQWRRVAAVFQFDTWVVFITTFVFFHQMYLLVLKQFRTRAHNSYILYYIYGVLIEYSSRVSGQFQVKYLLGLWMCSCLIISTVFKSQLMTIMAGVGYGFQLTSLEQLPGLDLRINALQVVANLYETGDYPYERYIYEHNTPCRDVEQCIRNVAQNKTTIAVGNQLHMDILRPQFLDVDGRSQIYILPNKVQSVNIQLFTSRGFPVFEPMDRMILLLMANGWVDHTYSLFKHFTTLKELTSLNRTRPKLKYDLTTVGLPFALLCFGYGLSLFAFGVELALDFVQKCNQKFAARRLYLK